MTDEPFQGEGLCDRCNANQAKWVVTLYAATRTVPEELEAYCDDCI